MKDHDPRVFVLDESATKRTRLHIIGALIGVVWISVVILPLGFFGSVSCFGIALALGGTCLVRVLVPSRLSSILPNTKATIDGDMLAVACSTGEECWSGPEIAEISQEIDREGRTVLLTVTHVTGRHHTFRCLGGLDDLGDALKSIAPNARDVIVKRRYAFKDCPLNTVASGLLLAALLAIAFGVAMIGDKGALLIFAIYAGVTGVVILLRSGSPASTRSVITLVGLASLASLSAVFVYSGFNAHEWMPGIREFLVASAAEMLLLGVFLLYKHIVVGTTGKATGYSAAR